MTDPAERMPYRPLPPSEQEKALAWKAGFAWRAMVLLVACAIALTLGTTVVTVTIIRDSQRDGRALLRQVKDCSETNGECAKRNRQRIAQAVAAINTSTLFTVTCGARRPNQSVQEIRACVARLNAALEANDPRGRKS